MRKSDRVSGFREIGKGDEYMEKQDSSKKRGLMWWAGISVSSLLIVCIVGFFVYRLYAGNPLEGQWISRDSGLVMTIRGNRTVSFEQEDGSGEKAALASMSCDIDKEAKTFILYGADEMQNTASLDSALLMEEWEISAPMGLAGGVSFNYNLEKNRLTLTEREYGETLVFDKK